MSNFDEDSANFEAGISMVRNRTARITVSDGGFRVVTLAGPYFCTAPHDSGFAAVRVLGRWLRASAAREAASFLMASYR